MMPIFEFTEWFLGLPLMPLSDLLVGWFFWGMTIFFGIGVMLWMPTVWRWLCEITEPKKENSHV